jgi:hypothetical protein
MGVISISKIFEFIEDQTEEDIKEKYILSDEINTKDMNFEKFLSYFREHNDILIEYMCHVDFEKAKRLLIKFINVFQIQNIDIDEKVNYIREYRSSMFRLLNEWYRDYK